MHQKVLGNHLYGFWTVDGRKLFDAEWEDLTYQNNSPEFHDGVVPMRKAGSTVMSKQPIYLLYSDGRSKMIPNSQSWFSVTNFLDGLAIAHGPVADGKCFYINTSGEKVFPHIVMNGMPLGGIRPLRDGLRAFCIGTGQWGYIDEKGTIKFPAKFKDAGNFSEGYAWVVTEDDVLQLIDKTGKSIFKAENRNVKTSEVVNGIFYVSDPVKNYMDYYDLNGNKLLTVESGNQFCDGYGYVYIPKSSFDMTTPISIIDKDMRVVKTLPPEIIEWSELSEHKPVFNSKDLATVYSGLVYQGSSIIRPNGTIVLRRYFNAEYGSECDFFSPVCDAGYFKAKITYYMSDKEVSGEAIMKTTGEVMCVISDAKSAAGPLLKNEIHFPTQNFPDTNTP
ncbi:MAG: WG repeat-containing protein, partial [Muribaculaceae bacterium]|nr:WG repeat-containing protein [Muribaculaceae bacterium]